MDFKEGDFVSVKDVSVRGIVVGVCDPFVDIMQKEPHLRFRADQSVVEKIEGINVFDDTRLSGD
ncbi:hypothetical protein LCGC14_2731080 [marine sediment metagenome]|uniref:DUF2187 domain-containing protein n=1 Tax=marine sediment metagenome TaxID=412755 RepID=A0A0F8Z7C7_9ZZZZ